MDRISRIDWDNYIRRLRQINEAAAQELIQWVETWGRDANGAMLLNLAEAVDNFGQTIVDAAFAITQKYGNAAGATAAAMYDATAELQGAVVPAAEMADNPQYWEVEKAVNGTLKTSHNVNELAGAVSRLVKMVGVDTTMKNAIRDGAEWAWVPSGDTCAFCLMLASRGWQRASKKALRNGHAEHIHSNCDCTYTVRHDSKMQVEGYDPDALYEQYQNADGTKWRDKLNSMRREQYAANKEKINSKKRVAYAKQKSQESLQVNELLELHTKYGSPEGLMMVGAADEVSRYDQLMKELGLTQQQIKNKMIADPDWWEAVLSSQTERQMEKLTDLLLDTASNDELGSLNLWTGASFSIINRAARYGVEVDPISAKAAKNIENVLNRIELPEDIIVKRGTGTSHMFEQMGVNWGDNPDTFIGKTWDDKGFFATSPLKNGGFGGPGTDNAELFVLLPKGTHAAYIEAESHLSLEKELLVQRGYSYKVVKAEYRANPLFPDEKDLKIWAELIKK